MIEPVQLFHHLHTVNSGTLSSPTVNSLMPHWIIVWKIFTVQTNQERLKFLNIKPSRHTTSFQRLYDVSDVV